MKKGFTLLEIVVVVAIIMILSVGGAMAMGKRVENNARERVRIELPTYIRNIIDKSFEEGRSYSIGITETGVLTLSNGANVSDTLELPSNLRYTINPAGNLLIGERGEFTFNNGNTMFTITVRTQSNETVMIITGTNIAGLNLGRINVQ